MFAAFLSASCAVAADGATAPTPGVQRAIIAEAIADEEHAWKLLARWPDPKFGAARLRLVRALNALRDVRPSVTDVGARISLDRAISTEIRAIAALDGRDAARARDLLYAANFEKGNARWWLTQPPLRAQECADRRDNDGDGLVDGAFDSGCSSHADGTERSDPTCSVATRSRGREVALDGTCSGPYGRVVVELDGGGAFDGAHRPAADGAAVCGYVSERRLECVFRAGTATRGHRIRLRFRLMADSPAPTRIRISDFRDRPFALSRRTAPASSAPPSGAFQVGAIATYAHGTASSNVCVFVWTVPGQPPLRGGVTLAGPSGRQTKAFTTLGGERKTRVVFTVTERVRYVATVVLAAKTAQAAVSLGQAPTLSGDFACPPP